MNQQGAADTHTKDNKDQIYISLYVLLCIYRICLVMHDAENNFLVK